MSVRIATYSLPAVKLQELEIRKLPVDLREFHLAFLIFELWAFK